MAKLRVTGAVLLMVLAALMVVTTIAARYARSQLLDTDAYVATVGPLASDPAVQDAVTNRVTTEIMQRADIPAQTQQLAGQLDVRGAQAIAALATPAITQWATDQVTRVVHKFVTSDRFKSLWVAANRRAHDQLNNVLTGQNGTVISTQGEDIVVDLGGVLNAAKDQLIAQGWTFLERIPDVSIKYTVAHVDNLPALQQAVSVLDNVATWLPFVAVAVTALAIWCAPDRRSAVFSGLLLVSIMLLLEIVSYNVGRSRYQARVAERGLDLRTALVLWDTMLRYLVDALQTVFVMALLAAVGVFLAGPSRVAVMFQNEADRVISPASRRIGPAVRVRQLVGEWGGVAGIVIGLGLLLWLLLSPTTGTAIGVGFIAGAAVLAFALLRPLPNTVAAAQASA